MDSASASTMVVDFVGYCHDFFPRPGISWGSCSTNAQHSVPIYLEAGNDYAIEGQQRHWGGWGYLAVGIAVPSSKPAYNSMREIERIAITVEVNYEVQQVDIPLASAGAEGFFTVFYTSRTSWGYITNFQEVILVSDATNMAAVHEKLSFVGSRSVTQCTSSTSNGICFEVKFLSLQPTNEQRELLSVRYAADTIVCDSDCGLSDSDIEATRLVEGDAAVGGTFRIQYGPYSTDHIPWGASANSVAVALEKAAGIPGGKFYVIQSSYSSYHKTYDIEFVGHVGPVFSSLVVNTTGMFGGASVTASTVIVKEGTFDRLLSPVPSYMLFTQETEPQVHVYTGSHIASCNITTINTVGSCPFTPKEDLTPVVSSVE
eukprot:scaffold36700_cov45-Prasinocladus_malaysianus.AAC.2